MFNSYVKLPEGKPEILCTTADFASELEENINRLAATMAQQLPQERKLVMVPLHLANSPPKRTWGLGSNPELSGDVVPATSTTSQPHSLTAILPFTAMEYH